MDAAKSEIASCLEEIFQPRAWWPAMTRPSAPKNSCRSKPPCWRASARIGSHPHERFHLRADLLGGQKTGIFLDQRENYHAAARYARGGKALDCFTSTGGFALHLAGKCVDVEAVDSSGPALTTARQNAEANGIANIHFQEADVFELLAGHAAARRQYSFVVWTRRPSPSPATTWKRR